MRNINLLFSLCVTGNACKYCDFSPFQVIPYSHNEEATNFSFEGNDKLEQCFLQNVLVKFPNNSTEIRLPWLNESYVHLNVSNNTLYFKVGSGLSNILSMKHFSVQSYVFFSSGKDQFQNCKAR